MRSRIIVGVFSVITAFCSLSIGGCSDNKSESTVELYKDVQSGNNSDSSVILKNIENNSDSSHSESGSDSSAKSEDKSSSDNSRSDIVSETPNTPDDEPTIFTGPNGEPVYDSDVTEIINYYNKDLNKKAGEITADDEGTYVVCSGFQYFKEPGEKAYNSYENPEMFDGFEFKGEMPENNNSWKRVNVGDEICGLKLKSAVSQFVIGYKEENDFEERGTYYNCDEITVYQYAENGNLVEFEGSITLTGFLSSSPRSYYFPNGGFMDFCPIENNLPVMCYNEFKTEPNTYELAGDNAAACAVGESSIIINIKKDSDIKNEQMIEFADEKPGIGDTVLARVTISNITYSYGHYSADFSDVEILSDVLAHEDDSI